MSKIVSDSSTFQCHQEHEVIHNGTGRTLGFGSACFIDSQTFRERRPGSVLAEVLAEFNGHLERVNHVLRVGQAGRTRQCARYRKGLAAGWATPHVSSRKQSVCHRRGRPTVGGFLLYIPDSQRRPRHQRKLKAAGHGGNTVIRSRLGRSARLPVACKPMKGATRAPVPVTEAWRPQRQEAYATPAATPTRH